MHNTQKNKTEKFENVNYNGYQLIARQGNILKFEYTGEDLGDEKLENGLHKAVSYLIREGFLEEQNYEIVVKNTFGDTP